MKGPRGMMQNKIIGITGSSGSGKTTVCEILAGHGGHIINADAVAHSVMEPGRPAYKKIVAAFGPDILKDEIIDRKKLGAIVFNDTKKRTQLENIVHPLVIDEILSQIRASKAKFVALDVVLLIESGLHRHCDVVWLVTAPEEMRLSRIIARDGLTLEAAQARMRNQRNISPESAQAVINNDGDLESLKEQISAALNRTL